MDSTKINNAKDQLTGIVDRFIFQNAENGFAVFVIQHKKETITAKGYVPAIHPGEHVHLQGSWIYHPKFGKQFEVAQCSSSLPTTLLGIKKYLSSGLIKGIGPIYAEKLVNRFKEEVLEVIDKEPDRLKEVEGIGQKRLERIVAAWDDQKEISHIMIFLQEKGVSPVYATKIYKKYGNRSIETMIENPYRIADDIWGIGFKTADAIAEKMGVAFDSIKRICSGTLYVISTVLNSGSLYIELEELKERTIELLGLDADHAPKQLKQALHALYEETKIKLITYQDYHYVALTKHYFSEKGVAQRIMNLNTQPSRINIPADELYDQLRNAEQNISLNEDQQRGIMTALQQKITVITGGPGTGKTTLIKSLLALAEKHGMKYKLAAPTGRAAKRMNEGTGKPAATIHRLLEFDVSTMSFVRNEENALPIDLLIIDEASMIDIFLAQAVLKAVSYHARLVLIGDVDQLPSVGAGNFLNDLIASNAVSSVRLTHIFRQAQDSLIVVNAHRINNGEFPTSSTTSGLRDFLFIKEEEPTHVPAHLEHIIKNGLKKFGLTPRDCMILVPMNRGSVGTQQLNHYLQQIVNKTNNPQQMQYAGNTFRIDDRVMQLRNNYDKNVFNGDIGFVTEINQSERTMTVLFDNRPVTYQSAELDELVLAYAVSIHKSQGSEYPAVVVPIFMQHFTLLQRNLIYTAITRAKKLCIFLGQPKAIAMAINNNKTVKRTTFLQEFLTTDLSCR